METSTEELEQRKREEETHNLLYSPCYFSQQIIKAFLKCLGLDYTTEQQPHDEDPLLSHTEDEFAVVKTTGLSSSAALRRPPRPPISSGGGGQINTSSS